MNAIAPFRALSVTVAVAAAAAGFLSAAGAHAEPAADYQELLNYQHYVSTRTRAEVRDEVVAARRAGTLGFGERDEERRAQRDFKSTKTRQQVALEATEANRLRQQRARSGEADLLTADTLR